MMKQILTVRIVLFFLFLSPASYAVEKIQTVEVSLTDYALNPSTFNLNPGKIQFNVTNDGTDIHSFRVEWKAEGKKYSAATSELNKGEKAALLVELPPGEYEVYCYQEQHQEWGMGGKLIVGENK